MSRQMNGSLTVLIDKPFQKDCEFSILLHCFDSRQVVQCFKCMLIAVIDLLDVRICHHNVRQEL